MYSLSHCKWAPGMGVALSKQRVYSTLAQTEHTTKERFKSVTHKSVYTAHGERFPRAVLYGDWGTEKVDSHRRAFSSAQRRFSGTRRGDLGGKYGHEKGQPVWAIFFSSHGREKRPAYRVRSGLGFQLTPCTTCLLYTSPSPRDQRGSRMACCA